MDGSLYSLCELYEINRALIFAASVALLMDI